MNPDGLVEKRRLRRLEPRHSTVVHPVRDRLARRLSLLDSRDERLARHLAVVHSVERRLSDTRLEDDCSLQQLEFALEAGPYLLERRRERLELPLQFAAIRERRRHRRQVGGEPRRHRVQRPGVRLGVSDDAGGVFPAARE